MRYLFLLVLICLISHPSMSIFNKTPTFITSLEEWESYMFHYATVGHGDSLFGDNLLYSIKSMGSKVKLLLSKPYIIETYFKGPKTLDQPPIVVLFADLKNTSRENYYLTEFTSWKVQNVSCYEMNEHLGGVDPKGLLNCKTIQQRFWGNVKTKTYSIDHGLESGLPGIFQLHFWNDWQMFPFDGSSLLLNNTENVDSCLLDSSIAFIDYNMDDYITYFRVVNFTHVTHDKDNNTFDVSVGYYETIISSPKVAGFAAKCGLAVDFSSAKVVGKFVFDQQSKLMVTSVLSCNEIIEGNSTDCNVCQIVHTPSRFEGSFFVEGSCSDGIGFRKQLKDNIFAKLKTIPWNDIPLPVRGSSPDITFTLQLSLGLGIPLFFIVIAWALCFTSIVLYQFAKQHYKANYVITRIGPSYDYYD